MEKISPSTSTFYYNFIFTINRSPISGSRSFFVPWFPGWIIILSIPVRGVSATTPSSPRTNESLISWFVWLSWLNTTCKQWSISAASGFYMVIAPLNIPFRPIKCPLQYIVYFPIITREVINITPFPLILGECCKPFIARTHVQFIKCCHSFSYQLAM